MTMSKGEVKNLTDHEANENSKEDSHKTSGCSHSLFSPIPRDVISSWLQGNYLIGGSESVGYENIGYSLMMRGTYVYKVFVKTGNVEGVSHAGLCLIDLKDGDLTFQGVRLFTNEIFHKDFKRDKFTPIFWNSIFSKICRDVNPKPHVFFGYVLHDKNPHEKIETLSALTSSRDWLNWHNKGSEGSPGKEPNSGFCKLTHDFLLSQDFCHHLNEMKESCSDQKTASQTISAVLHFDLGDWKEQLRKGEIFNVSDSKNVPSKGTIFFFPLKN